MRKPSPTLSLAMLLAINLLNYIDRYVLVAVEPDIGSAFFHRHADSARAMTETGSLATAFLLTYMIAAPLLGWLADRMSRWILIGISVGVWSVATAGSGWATTFGMLLLLRCVVGIGEAGYGPAAPTIIADLYPVERRGAVMSWFFMAIPVGSALGYVIGGFVGTRFGWRMAFEVVAPPGILLAIICLFLGEPRKAASGLGERSAAPASGVMRSLVRNRSFVLDTLGMAAMTGAIGGMSFWMPRYLCGDVAAGCRGLPPSAKAIFGGITAATGLLATLLGGIVGDRLRPRLPGSYFWVSAAGMLLACPMLLLFLITPFPWAWLPLAGCVFCLFFNTGPSNTILANVTHPSIRATAFAVNIFVIHLLGDASMPPILGAVAGRFGWNPAFGVVIGLMLASAVLWAVAAPFLQADTTKIGDASAV